MALQESEVLVGLPVASSASEISHRVLNHQASKGIDSNL